MGNHFQGKKIDLGGGAGKNLQAKKLDIDFDNDDFFNTFEPENTKPKPVVK